MVVRELFAKIGLNVDKESFDKGDSAIAVIRRGLLALGTVAAGAAAGIGLMVREMAENADRIDKTSQALGVSRRELQELEHAARSSGVGIDQFRGAFRTLVKATADARAGNATAAESFRQLGVRLTDAGGVAKSNTAVFEEVVARFGSVRDEAERTALALRMFGGDGARLIPLLAAGSDALADVRREAHELGIVMSEEDITAALAFSNAMTRVQGALQGLRYLIAGPMLTTLAEALEGVTAWIRTNRELVAANVRGFILGVVGALRLLFAIIGPIVKVLSRLVMWIVTSERVLKTLKWAIYALLVPLGLWAIGLAATALQTKLTGAAISSFLLPALLNWIQTQLAAAAATWAAIAPLILLGLKIALVAAVVFALGEEIYSLWEGSSSVFNDIGYLLGELWTEMKWLWKQFDAWASGIVDGWKASFLSFFEWIIEKLKALPGQLKEGVKGFASSIPGGEFVMNRFFGGGSSPEASAESSPTTNTNATTVNAPVNAPVTINAAPGVSAEDIASEATNQLQSALDSWLSETAAVVG